jgi:hypothetical protein
MSRDLNSGNSSWEPDGRHSATEIDAFSAASTLNYGVHFCASLSICVSLAKYLRTV